ncbi:hypothetical protein BFU36_00200 [Sulfolobus sp. A20]|uniref:hypothetical protein n=1 Tax=Sulfolobaceae TaxID=118883 RepID=UPI0008460DF4|nr:MULTISPECIES: hypothetical protein [unclassified Sulfolobus]AOL15415.1 hypothetical protein BFU36_00200 [Sulfolobus sp. A20]
MLQGRTNRLLIITSTLIISLGAISKLIPLFVIGIVMMVNNYKKTFNPISKDSIYNPELQRQTAYILFILAILEGITGFGAGPQTSTFITVMTLGLLNRGNSLELHLILIAPLAFFFILHSTSGLGNLLLRKGVKSKAIYSYVLPLAMLTLFAIAFYLDTLYFF